MNKFNRLISHSLYGRKTEIYYNQNIKKKKTGMFEALTDSYTILDLFSGAGGLSEGFFRTGFSFTCHIEKDQHSAQTLETRSYYHELVKIHKQNIYYDYLKGEINRLDFLNNSIDALGFKLSGIINREINGNTEKEIVKKAKKQNKKEKLNKIDLIIGGPPCQAYSIIGRSRDPNKMQDDPRNFLYLHYLHFLKRFKPEIFVFENVPGIQSAGNGRYLTEFKKHAERIGYFVDTDHILNASDFFVLQSRRRLFIMGWKKSHNFSYPEFHSVQHDFRVHDLLDDLPSLAPGEGSDNAQPYSLQPSEYLQKTGIRTDDDILINHQARMHNERDREIYRLVINAFNNGKRLKYYELPKELKTHKKERIFKDRFKVVEGKEKYCHSILAHISKDGHYFIHPDINQARSLTAREAARIQSFPDNYKFEGSRTSQFTQIGNAVPPLMSEAIARKILGLLNSL